MNWFTWEQHKKQFLIIGIFLVIFAALIVPARLHLYPLVQHVATACSESNATSDCTAQSGVTSFDTKLFGITNNVAAFMALVVPFILGLFVGVPLVANEYINGTNKLVWTRSISRQKWLTTKLLWMLGAAVLFAGASSMLIAWWARVDVIASSFQSGGGFDNRFATGTFGKMGLALPAYAFFAVALGVGLGVWFKRILTAIAVTLGVLFIVVQIVVPNFVRPYYETRQTVNVALDGENVLAARAPSTSSSLGQAWIISGSIVNSDGQTLNVNNPPTRCADVLNTSNTQGQASCLSSLGYHWAVKYQPASKYWDFQWIETGLYLGLSLIPIGATYWLMLKRDA